MKLVRDPSKWHFKNNYKGLANDFNVAVGVPTVICTGYTFADLINMHHESQVKGILLNIWLHL